MTPERWQKVNKVFQSAMDRDPNNRADYLDEACKGDDSLRDQVETLLAANDQAGTFMAGNAAGDHGHLLTGDNHQDITGQNLAHYEILSVLGKGGMGKVYLARDSRLNRSVAIKTLPYLLSGASDYIKRLQTEAKAAANLNHPNVATVYSVEETEKHQVFITMEYVEGKSLNDHIPKEGLDVRTFLDWFVPIADALSHAHDKGIVHRDIKPNNIMITEAGSPKILDFGLARFDRSAGATESSSTLGLTKTGQVLGTPAYMSPEQAEGNQADRRSDIFSLGVVMYEAITGERPFKGDNYASIVSKLMTSDPRSVSELRPDVPYIIARLIMKCLRKEPRQRYQTMREVSAILKEVRSALDSGASLSKASRGFKLTRPISNREMGFAAAAVVLLCAAGFFAWKWWSSEPVNAAAPVRFSIDPPIDQEIRLFETDITRDGKHIVFASRSKGVRTLFVRALDRFEMTPVQGSEDAVNPFFSPDSRWIAYFLDDGSLKKVPFEGGESLTICTACKDSSYGYWADDGYIYASDAKGIFRIGEEGGSPERITTIDEAKGEKSHRSPELLPNQKSVLFSRVERDTVKFSVVDLGTKEIRTIEGVEGETSTHGGISLARYEKTGHLLFAKAGQIFSVKFDPESFTVDGTPLPVVGGVFAISNFHVSDNGTLIYLPEAVMDENQLVWVTRTGETRTAVEKRGDYRSPKISPEGSRIAVQMGGDIWVFEPDSGRNIRLTFEGNNFSPLWTPDGRSILYASESGATWRIFRRAADGTGDPEQLYSGDTRALPYSFHPTEPLVALATMPGTNQADISLLSLTDNKITPLIKTEFKEDSPVFSPDGEKIAYFSMETGTVEIYISPWRKDAAAGKTVVSTSGGMYPVWSGDGKEVYFRSGPRLLAAEVGPGLQASRPRVLFEGKFLTGFDVSKDGSRFLMIRNEHGTMPSTLHVILNWSDELSRSSQSSN